ncbi:hypothetical protein C0992_013041, partial [Termitomyces sp. T32_za158]
AERRRYSGIARVWREVRTVSVLEVSLLILPRVLLHTETADGTVIPIWEEVTEDNVLVMKDVMGARHCANNIELKYYRVPMTAERPPDFVDLNDLIEVVLSTSTTTPLVVNCQLGRGRSTMASVGVLRTTSGLLLPDQVF